MKEISTMSKSLDLKLKMMIISMMMSRIFHKMERFVSHLILDKKSVKVINSLKMRKNKSQRENNLTKAMDKVILKKIIIAIMKIIKRNHERIGNKENSKIIEGFRETIISLLN